MKKMKKIFSLFLILVIASVVIVKTKRVRFSDKYFQLLQQKNFYNSQYYCMLNNTYSNRPP